MTVMFATLPPDVLEHIAYFASTRTLLGPPSGLYPLLAVSRSTNANLSRSTNPHLYARIFAAKFDLAAPRRRLARLFGSDSHSVLSVNALADELVRRFTILKRLREELDARSTEPSGETTNDSPPVSPEADSSLDELLWTAFLMVLENAGRNAAQLRNARIEGWLSVFWFDTQGASGAIRRLSADRWPVTPAYSSRSQLKIRHALGMWLFWFFLDPAAYVANPDLYRRAERILKLVALNAPLYPLSHLAWTSFRPESSQIHFGVPGASSAEPLDPRTIARSDAQLGSANPSGFVYFGRELPHLRPLPPAVPANLALLALHTRNRRNADTLEGGLELLELLGPSLPEQFIALPENAPSGESGMPREEGMSRSLDVLSPNEKSGQELVAYADSYRWEFEWLRCVHTVDENGLLLNPRSTYAPQPMTSERKYQTYQPGSLDGSWEGPFTYTEFHSFAALLAGAWPSKLQDCLIAQHNQTWRLREYHLLSPPSSQMRSSPSSSTPAKTNGTETGLIPLPVGDAILAHLPEGIITESDSTILRLTLPSSFSPPPSLPAANVEPLPRVYTYTRCRENNPAETNGEDRGRREGDKEDEESYTSRVVDILLSGEGHSGWGEFRLMGRVRPADGFICITKAYTGGDRGRWLYRGYLVGAGVAPSSTKDELDGGGGGTSGSEGYIAGRWRDGLTPAETHGYEGAFAMARRR